MDEKGLRALHLPQSPLLEPRDNLRGQSAERQSGEEVPSSVSLSLMGAGGDPPTDAPSASQWPPRPSSPLVATWEVVHPLRQ